MPGQSQEPEARSPKPEARSPKPEARSPKPEARSPKPEALDTRCARRAIHSALVEELVRNHLPQLVDALKEAREVVVQAGFQDVVDFPVLQFGLDAAGQTA